jgi:sugar (pentulose or hexulose) kinase
VAGELLLAVDVGTQSVRALLFDLRGNLLDRSRVKIVPYVSPRPGWAEQEPSVYWDATVEACRSLLGRPGVRREAIAGMTVTAQRATVVNLDSGGEPLRPAIVWLDQRRTQGLPRIGGFWGASFKAVGMTDTVAAFQDEAEANWIRTHQPEVWERTAKFLLLSGYLLWKLTGRYADSTGSQVGYLPFDFRRHRWARSIDWKWTILPLRRDQLPDLVPPGTVLGPITPAAAEATGLPAGLPVVASAADKACEVLGSGCPDPHVACLSYGTTATINTTFDRYVEPYPMIPPYPSAIPGSYDVEIQIYRGYWLVSWFKEQFGHPEERIASERGIEAEELFDELVDQVPPGAMGLVLQPTWSPGVKIPGPEAKGAVIGFGDVHTRAHLYRAILEGLAYGLREGKERTERRSGVPITELRVAGGGSRSDAALQITADVFDLPTARPHVTEASGLGAAIDAAVGLKLHPGFPAAVAEMTRVGRVFEPDRRRADLYEQLYQRVYRQMYRRLRPLYREIREITGYPA